MPMVPAPKPWNVNGKTYYVNKLTALAFSEIGQLAFMEPPPQYKVARDLMNGLPEATQKHIWDTVTAGAPKVWPPPEANDPTSPEYEHALGRVLMTRQGQEVYVYHACKRSSQGFTRETAKDVVDVMSQEEWKELTKLVRPDDADEVEIEKK